MSFLVSLFESLGSYNDHHNQAGDNQGSSNGRHDDYGASRCGEFASNNVVLTLEVAMETQ